MNILIIYMSSHGCAENIASTLASKFENHLVELHNLKNRMLPHLAKYDAVILGGSIHAGEIQTKIKTYCERNIDVLLKKNIGLYLCCMEKGEIAKQQFEKAYPEQLRKNAVAKALMGGEFTFEKMSFFEKTIVKRMANVNESVSAIKYDIIDEFAKKITAAEDEIES
jgi:menaquinone-dependent protoporphyrinogen oxidase